MNANVKGMLWALLSAFTFATSVAAIKAVGGRIPVFEVAFFSAAGQLLFIGPRGVRQAPALLRAGARPLLQFIRVALIAAGTAAGFYAVMRLPIANATSISFAKAMFITLLAVVVLAERIGWRRWGATLVGLGGVLLLMRPDMDGAWLGLGAAAGLFSAACTASAAICTRILAQDHPVGALMFYQAVVSTLLLAPLAALDWVTPSGWDWALLLVVALSGVAGNLATIVALRLAEASALAPIDYSRLVFATGAGILLFNETPDGWTLLGMGIVVASSLYVLRSEAKGLN
jgi:drug/metabolite transporter (DMT)-like permease